MPFAPIFFARYVDDIFILLRSSDHVANLAEYLSSKHPNIRFTYKLENNNTLPFLDVNVFRDASKFSSSVHRKMAFSGIYSNFSSFMPVTYKRGLVSTLLYRAYIICSSFQTLYNETENLKKIFSHFLIKLYEKKVPVATVPKKDLLMLLPFLGTTSWKIKNDLIRTIRKNAPACNIKIIFKTTKRLSSCFTFKDKFPKSLLSGVIYKYTCAKCKLCYIGCTKRFWEKRLEEHLHVSALTGKPLQGMQIYAPMQHVRNSCPGRRISREDFEIIGHEKNKYLVLRI